MAFFHQFSLLIVSSVLFHGLSEIRCPASIDNGDVDETCKRGVGDKCGYTCDVGFVKTREMAVCTKDETYHAPKDGLCAPYKCSSTLENGLIDDLCARTIGSSCSYTCKKFYTPNVMYPQATCQAGGWSPAPSDLCQESICKDSSFQNGQVSGECLKKVGDACTYECDDGYVNTTELAFCKSDKMWHPNNLCTPYTCSDRIENGLLDPKCARTIGRTCSYTCDKYYTPTIKKAQVECQAGGWNPVDLCKESVCDASSLQNGKVTDNCLKKIGAACAFDCNQGYVNTTNLAFCKDDYMWHPNDACTEYKCSDTIDNGDLNQGCTRNVGSKCTYTCNKHYNHTVESKEATCTANGWNPSSAELCEAVTCPSTVPNGKISEPCDLTVGSTCDYKCNDGYTATEAHPNITCKRSGEWVSQNLCIVPIKEEAKLSVPGVAAGMSVLGLIVLILVVAVICLVIKKRSSSKYSSFDDSGIAVENPGYRQRMSFPDINRDDHPYSTPDEAQMKPMSTTSFSEGVSIPDDEKT